MTDKIIVFDTTLRDGEQSPGCSMNLHEKLEVARQLERLGVNVIEAGFPISSPGDFDAVQAISQEIKGATICGLARALEKDITRCGEAIKNAAHGRIHTFIATSDVHVEKKLRMSKEKVIQIAVDAVKHAKTFTEDVEFSPEDAGRTDWGYMREVLEAVIEAGATTLNIPDTVGYCTPEQFGGCIKYLMQNVKGIDDVIVSVHCHNDLGMAVANSLAAIKQGARQVECTINGLGERAGNAAMEEIIMNLVVRKDYYDVDTDIVTEEIFRTSRMVSQITGMRVQRNKAIVGANAFAHEAGIHQDGILKERSTYEIMTAGKVGWHGDNLIMGKHSGRNAFRSRLAEIGFIDLTDEEIEKAFERFKRVCDKKKDIYDDDLFAIVQEELARIPKVYNLEYCHISSGTSMIPVATVKVIKDEDEVLIAAHGDGPVDAIYSALGEATGVEFELKEYHIEAVTGGGDALGRVNVLVEIDQHPYKGTGTSTDIVLASAKAFLNAINRHEMAKASGGEQEEVVSREP
ncbi:MAG: 2-isopropylmalate synthase [Candidatus Sumerlaeota bacterium]